MWRNCALSSRQPHLNVFTSSGECYATNAHGADTIVIPQQQQHHQPAVDLGGEDIPFQQPSDTMHYSIGMSGGAEGKAMRLVPVSLAAVGITTMTTGTGVWRGSSSFTCNITAAWWRLVACRGGVPEVTGRAEVAPFLELFLAVMTGLLTGVSSRCTLFAPSPQTPPPDAVRNLLSFREPPPGFYDLSWGHRRCHPWRLFRGLRLQPSSAASVGAVSHAGWRQVYDGRLLWGSGPRPAL